LQLATLATMLLPSFFLLVGSVVVSGKPPHIVVLVADDLGWNDVSWHNSKVLTPHLAALADAGVKLEQHYSQDICSPSRAALLTGRYPIHTGFHNGVIEPKTPYGLDTSFTTLAQEMHRGGYATHIVGKWHLGMCREEFWPVNRGFDSFFGFLIGAQTYFTHQRDGGYDFRDQSEVYFEGNNTYSSLLLADRATKIIAEHNPDTPLFLYLPFQSVHGPLEAPKEYLDLYPDIKDPERQLYLAMVTAMDDAVGQVVASLEEAGLYQDSVILFFSDNGGPVKGWPPGHDTSYAANNWPLRGGKYSLWEGGTRTLASITAPGILQPAATSSKLTHVTDWFPTLLSAAGIAPSEEGLDGIDQWAALKNPSMESVRHEMVYNIFYPTWDLSGGPPVSALRQGDWKFLRRTVGFAGWGEAPEQSNITDSEPGEVEDVREQLFNLSVDPEERENLAEVETERAAEMLTRLLEIEEGMSGVRYPENTDAGDPANFGGIWDAGWC